jgi:hypothetical protein
MSNTVDDFQKDEESLKTNLCEALYEEEGAEAYNDCQSMTVEQIKERISPTKYKQVLVGKKGMSKGVKWAIGIGGIALIGFIIYKITK